MTVFIAFVKSYYLEIMIVLVCAFGLFEHMEILQKEEKISVRDAKIETLVNSINMQNSAIIANKADYAEKLKQLPKENEKIESGTLKCTVPQPFSFNDREKSTTIRQIKLSEMQLEKEIEIEVLIFLLAISPQKAACTDTCSPSLISRHHCTNQWSLMFWLSSLTC